MGRKDNERTISLFDAVIGTVIAALILGAGAMLIRIDNRTSITADRVDRIAAVLPDLGRMFAWEELNKSVDSILLTTKPQQSGDSWIVQSLMMNMTEGTQTVFGTTVPGPDYVHFAYRGIGAVERIGPVHQSMYDMVSWSAELERPYKLPDTIDAQSSFVFRDAITPALFDYYTETLGPPIVITGKSIDEDWEAALDFMNDTAPTTLAEAMLRAYGMEDNTTQ